MAGLLDRPDDKRGRDKDPTSLQAADLAEAHRHGIPLPTEPEPDPEAEVLDRLQLSATKNLVTVDDPDAAMVADLVATVPTSELLRRARRAVDAEGSCAVDNPATARAELDAAVAARCHLVTGRRVRAIDRDNVGHVVDIDDTTGTCTVHFDNVQGRTALRRLEWSELVVIDHPDPVPLTSQAAATLAERAVDVQDAEHQWTVALARHGVAPGDADLYRRAVHTAADHATRTLQAEPPAWLTTWLGPRPTTPAPASVWDDATTRVAHHRLTHNINPAEPGIGPRPDNPTDAHRWHQLMIRLLEDRIWLADHPTATVEPRTPCTPNELIDRQQELHQLLATAPADQRQFIDRVVSSRLDPAELHDHLSAAIAVQDARREWIITNWPHLVELQQVTQLIAAQQPLAHWPTAQPNELRDVLEQLRRLAPPLDTREQRTLAELDQLAADRDPVRKLEARRDDLRQLAARTTTPIERDTLNRELDAVSGELRQARRQRTIDDVFDRYTPNRTDDPCATRIATLAHDTLTTPPTWVVEHLRSLHDNDQLTTCDIADLATRITHAAADLDRHGHLPTHWTTPPPPARDVPQPTLQPG